MTTKNISTNIPINEQPTEVNNNTISETYYLETQPENIKLQKCWRYGKTTKLLSCIDIFFCVLSASFDYPLFLLFTLMPVCGYFGAKEYNINKTGVYVFYSYIMTIGKIIHFDYLVNNKYDYIDDYSNNRKNGIYFINFMAILVQIWVAWIITKFYMLILKLNDTERNTLQIGTYIPVIHTYLLY